MSNRKIIRLPDSLLRQQSLPIDMAKEDVSNLLEDLYDTCSELSEEGSELSYLAAPQIGVLKRVFVEVDFHGHPTFFINPEITSRSEAKFSVKEICPSLLCPNNTERHKAITFKYLSPDGEYCTLSAIGIGAAVYQRMIDLLAGKPL